MKRTTSLYWLTVFTRIGGNERLRLNTVAEGKLATAKPSIRAPKRLVFVVSNKRKCSNKYQASGNMTEGGEENKQP